MSDKKNGNSKKRILVICQHFWPESFRINDICSGFIEKGFDVDVLCGIPNYPKGEFFTDYSWHKNRKQFHNGCNITRVFEIKRGNNSNLRIFLNYVTFPIASIFHIPGLLFKKYDKIFIYQLSPVLMSISGILIGKIKKVEIVMYVLDLWPENLYSVFNIKSKFWRKIAESISHWHYKRADKLMAVSNKMKRKLHLITGKPEKDILFLPQCCEKLYEQDIFDETLKNRFSQGFNIVFAGNISPAQSFSTIIEASKMLLSDGILDINWIIVGDGMSKKWLEKEVADQNLKNWFFEGFKPITEIPKYHTIAQALIACLVKSDLLEATIPGKVNSYMAAGRPMLLCMDGEVQEIVNHDAKCGFACDTENSEVLYENIKKLYYMDVKEREQMGNRAKEYHFTHFERNLIVNKLINFMFDENIN
jgi:colanic acid biosynthesis glycosyl transferase WcaI